MTLGAPELPWATDPNTSPEELARLARTWPRQVLAHPVLPMLALADPGLWASIVGPARESMAMRTIKALCSVLVASGRRDLLRTWRLDCLERVAGGCEHSLSIRIKEVVTDARRASREMDLAAQVRGERWRESLRAPQDLAAYGALESTLMLTKEPARGPYVCAQAVGAARAAQGQIEQLARAAEIEWQAGHLMSLEAKSRPAPALRGPTADVFEVDDLQAFLARQVERGR